MSHFITLASAREYIQRYKDNLAGMLTSDYQDSLPFSETFDASNIQAILNQQGCVAFFQNEQPTFYNCTNMANNLL